MKNKYTLLSEEAQAITKEAKEKRKEKKMCGDKTGYATKELAFQKGQDSYKCKYCGKYHRSTQISRLLTTLHALNPLGRKKKKRKSTKRVIKLNGKKKQVIKKH